jgi:hypothetical protein
VVVRPRNRRRIMAIGTETAGIRWSSFRGSGHIFPGPSPVLTRPRPLRLYVSSLRARCKAWLRDKDTRPSRRDPSQPWLGAPTQFLGTRYLVPDRGGVFAENDVADVTSDGEPVAQIAFSRCRGKERRRFHLGCVHRGLCAGLRLTTARRGTSGVRALARATKALARNNDRPILPSRTRVSVRGHE